MILLFIVFNIFLIAIINSVSSESKASVNRRTQKLRDSLAEEEKVRQITLEERAKEFIANFETCFNKAAPDAWQKYIVIDFETSDLPFDNLIPKEVPNIGYPRALSGAALVFDKDGAIIDQYYSLFNVPEDTFIHPSAFAVNKISIQDCKTKGKDIGDFFEFLLKYLRPDVFLVAHNIKFDNYFLKLECRRNAVKLPKYLKFCTMDESKQIIAKVKTYGSGLKNPNLKEMVECAFFDRASITITNTHNALVDAKLCALCFFKLKLNERCQD